jgi:two-component system LytT family response regulator
MINCIIVDDEVNCAETLQMVLDRHCKSVNVLEVINNSQLAEESIRTHSPDLVFLDIEMPHLNGFDVLSRTKDVPFAVIFTTAYDHYALKAIKHHAIDYLLKPIDVEELIAAIEKVEKTGDPDTTDMFKMLFKSYLCPVWKALSIWRLMRSFEFLRTAIIQTSIW